MRKIDGMVEDGFETIRDAFAEAQVQDEGGAQLCVYRHGKRIVDLWTGRDAFISTIYHIHFKRM